MLSDGCNWWNDEKNWFHIYVYSTISDLLHLEYQCPIIFMVSIGTFVQFWYVNRFQWTFLIFLFPDNTVWCIFECVCVCVLAQSNRIDKLTIDNLLPTEPPCASPLYDNGIVIQSFTAILRHSSNLTSGIRTLSKCNSEFILAALLICDGHIATPTITTSEPKFFTLPTCLMWWWRECWSFSILIVCELVGDDDRWMGRFNNRYRHLHTGNFLFYCS